MSDRPAPRPLLIVDDDPEFALCLQRLLELLETDRPFAVTWVDSAAKALANVRHHAYDVVLLDNKLPGADGLEILGQINQLPLDQRPPVIMLTATGNEALAVQAMKQGAKDYLPKLDLALPSLTRAITGALERTRLERQVAQYTEQLRQINAQLREKNELLEADLHLARELQQAFLPQQCPAVPRTGQPAACALQFCHRYLPTAELGGDFFDVLPLSDTTAGVFIGDVMGHGVRAALVTAILRGLVEELTALAHDPGRFLTEINRGLIAILKQQRKPLFASAFYLVIDVATLQLRYANAGHPSPIHLRRHTGVAEPLAPTRPAANAALGLFADHVYPTHTCALAPADLIVMFTDGLFEVEGRQHEQYGEDRLLQATRQRAHLPAPQLLDELLGEIRQFSQQNEFADDVCLVGIDIAPANPTSTP